MVERNAASMGTYGSTWEAHGYSGVGPCSSLIDSLKGRPAVVCGNAEGVFQELAHVTNRIDDVVVFGVNDAGMYLPRLDHWCSLHVDNLGLWKGVRWTHHRGQEDARYHSIDNRPFIDYNWEGLTPLFALSGYFAMQIAWVMGCDPIILCGCPGESRRNFFQAKPRDNFGYGGGEAGSDKGIRQQLESEMRRLPDFKASVRSMSGWTQQFFGGF